jgi:hypothetical protein
MVGRTAPTLGAGDRRFTPSVFLRHAVHPAHSTSDDHRVRHGLVQPGFAQLTLGPPGRSALASGSSA